MQRRRHGFESGGAKSGAKRRTIFLEVPPHFWAVPLLMGGTYPLCCLHAAATHYYRVVQILTVRQLNWHCLKDVLVCRVVNSTSQSIDNRKEIHDLNYLGVRGFSEAS